MLRRRDVIWGQLDPSAPSLDVSIEDWDDVSDKEDEDVVTIPLPRNLNPYFEDVLEASQGFIEEISENENLQDPEVDPTTELSPAEAIQEQIINVNPTAIHWKALKRVLRYLAGTRNRGIIYGGAETSLCGYTDADWVGDQDYARSTAGHVFTLNGGVIS